MWVFFLIKTWNNPGGTTQACLGYPGILSIYLRDFITGGTTWDCPGYTGILSTMGLNVWQHFQGLCWVSWILSISGPGTPCWWDYLGLSWISWDAPKLKSPNRSAPPPISYFSLWWYSSLMTLKLYPHRTWQEGREDPLIQTHKVMLLCNLVTLDI